MLGQCTSAVEISVASNQGFWLLVDDEELYVPFDEFPWFKRASFEQVMLVERPGADHLYWPLLDVDLSLQSIRHPERFPLVSRN